MLQERLASITDEIVKRKEYERNRQKREMEAEEKRKTEGTPVTVESFVAWKKKFDAEMALLKLKRDKELVTTQYCILMCCGRVQVSSLKSRRRRYKGANGS